MKANEIFEAVASYEPDAPGSPAFNKTKEYFKNMLDNVPKMSTAGTPVSVNDYVDNAVKTIVDKHKDYFVTAASSDPQGNKAFQKLTSAENRLKTITDINNIPPALLDQISSDFAEAYYEGRLFIKGPSSGVKTSASGNLAKIRTVLGTGPDQDDFLPKLLKILKDPAATRRLAYDMENRYGIVATP
jgi:hypothetical protein